MRIAYVNKCWAYFELNNDVDFTCAFGKLKTNRSIVRDEYDRAEKFFFACVTCAAGTCSCNRKPESPAEIPA